MELAFSGIKLTYKPLEEIINEEPLTDIEMRRRNFHFVRDFDFNIDSYSKEVYELFGRHNFDKTHPNWKKEKQHTRQIYHEKVAEYLINHYKWPKWLANKTSKIAALPDEEPKNKTFSLFYTGLKIIEASASASFTENYRDPIAKISGIKPEHLTGANIIMDSAILISDAVVLYGLYYLHNSADGFVAEAYANLGLNKVFNTLMLITTGARALQIGVRTLALKKYNKHIPSYASLTGPNPINFIPAIIIFGREAYVRSKKTNKEEPMLKITKGMQPTETYHELTPSIEYSSSTKTQSV